MIPIPWFVLMVLPKMKNPPSKVAQNLKWPKKLYVMAEVFAMIQYIVKFTENAAVVDNRTRPNVSDE